MTPWHDKDDKDDKVHPRCIQRHPRARGPSWPGQRTSPGAWPCSSVVLVTPLSSDALCSGRTWFQKSLHPTIWTQQTKQLGSYCANCACYFVNGLASDQMVANGQIGPIQPFAKALLVPANSPSGLATIFFPAIHFVAAQGPLKLREPWPLLKTAETSRSNVTLWLLPRSNSRSNFLCSLCTLSPGILGEPHVSLQSQKSHPVLVNCKAAAFFAVTSLFVFFTFILTDAVQYRKQWKSLELVQCSSSAHFL